MKERESKIILKHVTTLAARRICVAYPTRQPVGRIENHYVVFGTFLTGSECVPSLVLRQGDVHEAGVVPTGKPTTFREVPKTRWFSLPYGVLSRLRSNRCTVTFGAIIKKSPTLYLSSLSQK